MLNVIDEKCIEHVVMNNVIKEKQWIMYNTRTLPTTCQSMFLLVITV